MDVAIPQDLPQERADAIKAQEREYSQQLRLRNPDAFGGGVPPVVG